MTTLPRWTSTPPPAARVEQLDEALPDDLAQALARAVADLGASDAALLLAAHARVLATLTGEGVVTLGHSRDHSRGGDLVPLTIAVGGSWRELVAAVSAAMSDAAPADQDTFDSAAGVGSGPAGLPAGVQLAVHAVLGTQPPRLQLRYRTDAVDTSYAQRLAGYHVRALDQLATDPDAPVDAACLVGAAEIRHQLEAFAGPARRLPDARVHELIEDQVRAHPQRAAAAQGDREWSYAQLNARADAVGRHLLADGLRGEDVVAVVVERNLEWLAAVLAILKAGGAYLPIDPQFPPARIARVLARSGCRHVLTQQVSRGHLDAALESLGERRPAVSDLDEVIGAALDGPGGLDGPASDDVGLGIEIGPGRLAYLYFTSGSTGEPKGAMCEHAGMLNHILAKIDDLGIEPGDTVSQSAPQCFDISLWQLLAALVVGGRTLIVEQEAVLDVERFVDTLDAGGVAIAQVVPSYLEAVLTFLESRQRALPALRCVSVTGEALKAELARRWFATGPATRLVNAYGLTETSDDTNHEVMESAPTGTRVPLGRPIPNVRVYVVDDRLVPVPLGAPGEIVFAGVCVGRGYVNDPERSARAYLVDPFHAGERLYRGGDIGRWAPDGKLDFLGRRDHQVKVSGFRIEIGEVEEALTRAPGVRDAAVVVAESPGRVRQLVGFYGADEALDPDGLRAQLGARLPTYMVPHTLHHRAALPLTANGKIDRAALLALAAELAAALDEPVGGGAEGTAPAAREAPATPTEVRIAAAWARVLGVPVEQVGRRDHFFDRGGNSLAGVKLVIALERAITLRDLLTRPVLADLAAGLDAGLAAGRDVGREAGCDALGTTAPDGAAGSTAVLLPTT